VTAKKKKPLPRRHYRPLWEEDIRQEEEQARRRDFEANKPHWIDEEEVIALVHKLRDRELEAERQHALYGPGFVKVPNPAAFARFKTLQAEAARRAPPPPTAEERDAMAKALRGEPEQLASLVTSGRCRAPAALRLAAEFVRGARDPRTGKPRRGRGRPKMSSAERRARNPIHDAADEFDALRDIVRALYPGQSAEQINGLAERVAQERTGTKTSVLNYRFRWHGAKQRLR
jgi:hypothetical protein